MKKLLLALTLLITLALIASYAFFPSIAQYIVEQQIPSNTKLTAFDIKRPSLQGIAINQIIFEQTGNRLALEKAKIKVNWLNRSLQSIQLQSVDAHLSQPELLTSTQAVSEKSSPTANADDSNQFNPASLLAALPAIRVQNLRITLQQRQSPEITLTGSLDNTERGLQGNFNVDSNTDISGRLFFSNYDSQLLSVEGNLNHLDIEQLSRLFIMKTSNNNLSKINQLSGQLDFALKGDINLLATELDIINLDSKLSLQNGRFADQAIDIASINGDIIIKKDHQWSASGSSVTGNLQLSKLKLPIKSSSLPFQFTLNSFQIENNQADINATLTLDDQHSLNLLTKTPLDVTATSQHQLTFKLSNLNENFSPLFKQNNIQHLTIQSDFELQNTSSHWHLINLTTPSIVIKNLSSQQPVSINIPTLTLKPKWQKTINLSNFTQSAINEKQSNHSSWIPKSTDKTLSTVLEQLTAITINSHQAIKLSTWQTELHSAIDLNVDFLAQKFDATLSPTNNLEHPNNRSVISFDGVTKGNFNQSAIDFDSSAKITALKILPLLKSLNKQPSKLLNSLTLNSTNQITFNTELTGHWPLAESQSPEQSLQLAGSLYSNNNSLTVTGTTISDLVLHLSWQPLNRFEQQITTENNNISTNSSAVPWNTFRLSLSANADYQGMDKQQHKFSSDFWLDKPLKLKHLQLESQLLEGSLSIKSLPEYKPLNDVSGTLSVSNISLKKISSIMNKPELAMTGNLNGDLPFQFKDGHLNFKQGLLSSDNGIIEYLPQGKKIELTQETVSNIANITLQNFHYRLMHANLISGGPCGFDFKIRLEGHNPDIGKNSHQVFNINYQPQSNVNLFYLLLLGKENIKKLDQTLLHSGCVNNP